MKYSSPINFELPWVDMFNMYMDEFDSKLKDEEKYLSDDRIFPCDHGFGMAPGIDFFPVNELVKSLKLEINTARIFATDPNMVIPIHKDCVKNKVRSWAINIPIAYCDKGTNEWFSDDENDFGVEQYSPSDNSMKPEYEKEYTVSESMILDGIRLIRTDVMHRANNIGNDNRRVVLSLRGDPNITYDEVMERINNAN